MINKNNKRSSLIIKNIIASFAIKGWSALVVLTMVPLTLTCLGVYKNGVWLTISSLLVWIDQMDIGLGNGLRNKLAIHIAHNETEKARSTVSSTLAMLILIVLPLWLLLLLLIWKSNVYTLLNVDPDIIPELRTSLASAVTLVCMTFVLKFIGNIFMGLQLPAVSNFLMATGHTLALAFTALLYYSGHATFTLIVIANTLAPLLTYLLSYPYTFYIRYPYLRPSMKSVNLSSVMDLGNLGIKFFWLQLAGLIQFTTANILISQFFTPEMVTPYQIAYRYISIMMTMFTVICMPLWNATTDAYERGDMEWIKKASRKMNLMTLGIALILIAMVAVSPWVYSRWIGGLCNVPIEMTSMMAIYIFIMLASMRYSYFLNGMGALRVQLYMTISAVVFIPLAWLASNLTHSINWFMMVMCLCSIPGLITNIIQFNKIINGTATGFWRI